MRALCLAIIVATTTPVACQQLPTVPPELVRALHLVETGGREGHILGDNGAALGPLQIHRAYWQDSRVPGRYEDCARLDYSVRVLNAYMRRYCREALISRDFERIARVHNGGPRGHRKAATLGYWRKVQKHLK